MCLGVTQSTRSRGQLPRHAVLSSAVSTLAFTLPGSVRYSIHTKSASAYGTRAPSLLPLGAPAPRSLRLTPAATLRDSLSGGLCSSTTGLIRCSARMDLRGRAVLGMNRLLVLLMLFHTMARIMAEQEVENLSGLSTNPEKDIFVVRENGTTCLMAEFAAKFIVPYDVWASNYVDLITEQADISLTRGAEVKGHCGHNESELQVFWVDRAYALKMLFVKESHNTSKGPEATWRLSKVQFVYDSSEKTHFKDAVSAGKHTANSHHLSALVTPAGKSYECQAQQTISLASSDPQKTVTMILSAVHIQPFDIISDFVFSEEHKCPVDEREQLEETLPLILGLILGLVIVVTLVIYHLHHKMTANQVQIPRDRSQYKHMG
ncbi:lysosome-associated membrane glycoprotein 5 [Orcinus orca]|uniref:lysosome-associated membrane glycoprotein 5 n=1 Tax=Orcinus orca TaxID=9733 RepID=UPI0021115086|nr:lysosome-associated membrane glycoprotein 5 [Orcinus orca]